MRPVWLRRGDIAAACAVLVTALLAAIFLWFGRSSATQAVIRYPDGRTEVFALEQSRIVTVAGNNGIELTVEILDGRVRVRESGCPDQVCVHSGWLSRSGQTAACVPADVYVQIRGGQSAVDGVTS